jgi:CheY-like chemotaxis protein
MRKRRISIACAPSSPGSARKPSGTCSRSASTRDIPILLLSTTPDLLERARQKHKEFGGDRYLVKPFDLDDLIEAIRDLIGDA